MTGTRITASRYHDFCAGHRVFGHESKCAHLHGHNYRVHFTVRLPGDALDGIGRVLDFSVIRTLLCDWLEKEWDHKFLLWERDTDANVLRAIDPRGVVLVPFNPTAENMAQHLLNVIGPQQLVGTGVELVSVVIEETRKCSAGASKE